MKKRLFGWSLVLLFVPAVGRAEESILTVSDKGVAFTSPDGLFVLKFRGLVQADGREYLDDQALELNDTFVIRKARPSLDATMFGIVEFRVMPDFGNGQTVLQDAYADLRPFSWLGLRGGKFKVPVGLERYQADSATVFPERAFPTSLAPNRDVGFELFGSLFGGAISYEAGVFNGGLDNATEDVDTNYAKDFAGRLFLQPFKGGSRPLLANLGVGVGASTGNERGTPATIGAKPVASFPNVASYRTAGQQPFFSYLVNDAVADGTVIAKGRRTRISPQGYYYGGPVGVLVEYIQNSQGVQKGADTATLTHRAWQVAASYVIGGKPLFEGMVINSPFDVQRRKLGALEIAVRYSALDIDDAAFPLFADPVKSATDARALGLALNWHWSRNVKLTISYERTEFTGGLKDGDRTVENTLFQRLQTVF